MQMRLGCRGKGAEEEGERLLRESSGPTCKRGRREAKLIRPLAGRSKKFAQKKAPVKPQQQVNPCLTSSDMKSELRD